MVNSVELMQLCRLCLVKDEVNIPIFDNETDVQQIFLKISTCLPVKVTQDDNLPKKICNDCSYKLDLCYQFWNTSANSEKQLVTWLNEVGLSQETLNEAKLQKTESNSTPGLVLKQETIEPESESSHEVVNNVSTESQEYILQQQQLPYQTPAFPFTDDNFVSGESANAGASKTHTNNKRESTLKRKRQAVATVTQPDSDDDVDEDIDDPTETKVAKTEETSDDDRDDDGLNDEESTEFAGVPSTSTDNEQPGPSGIGKNVVDAPLQESVLRRSSRLLAKKQNGREVVSETRTGWSCNSCFDIFSSLVEYKEHKKFHKTVAAIVLKYKNSISDKKGKIHKNKTNESSEESSQSSDELESEYEATESNSASGSDSDVPRNNKETTCKNNIRSSQSINSPEKQPKLNQTKNLKNKDGITKINPWTCNYCNKKIISSLKAIEHLRGSHSSEKPFACTSCPRDAFTFEELQDHFQNYHRNNSRVQSTIIPRSSYSINTRKSAIAIPPNNLVAAKTTAPAQKERTVNDSLDNMNISSNVIQLLQKNDIGKTNLLNRNNIQPNECIDLSDSDNDRSRNSHGDQCAQESLVDDFDDQLHISSSDTDKATDSNDHESPCSSNKKGTIKKTSGKTKRIERNRKVEKSKKENEDDKTNPHEYMAICPFCDIKFKLSILLRTHLQSTHEKEGPFKCAVCFKECFTYRGLEKHFEYHHVGKTFKCYQCKKGFDSKEEVVFHRNEQHRNYCDICQTYYNTPRSTHNQIVHAEEKIKCTICDKTYKGKTLLALHMRRVHSGAKFPCSNCGNKFKDSSDLKRHFTVRHSEKKITICQVCGKVINVNNLKSHLKGHGATAIVCCKICKKSYKTRSGAQICQDKHSNFRRYKCMMCDKAYFTPGSLIVHKRLHTGEKPYSCSVCNRSFYTQYILYKHSLSHRSIKKN
ncbi:zinc finger protein 888 isoform X1 [Agrilus planipennis]|uniref:Zinc finger protein 888 isoform X1 n=1 Tax=Agrilus planipennis TaxID=224129 RepID=A0A7F5R9A8_AGRPL|nr:zinc finger protein 888 isoform X1 [Agrilus planipennis]